MWVLNRSEDNSVAGCSLDKTDKTVALIKGSSLVVSEFFSRLLGINCFAGNLSKLRSCCSVSEITLLDWALVGEKNIKEGCASMDNFT